MGDTLEEEAMKVKICGLKRIEDMEYANLYAPDYIGFVFAESKRKVSQIEAKELRTYLEPGIQVVGVFVDEEKEAICHCVQEGIIDVIQLHGNETEEDIVYLKSKTKVPVIKAISVTVIDDILMWTRSAADFLLLDYGKGGSGKKFDWAVLDQLDNLWEKIIIAGGLQAEDVRLLKSHYPYGVDVSGGVEENGVKNEMKIRSFIHNVRGQ